MSIQNTLINDRIVLVLNFLVVYLTVRMYSPNMWRTGGVTRDFHAFH